MYRQLIILLTLFCLSCKSDKLPEGVISEEKMIEILMDVYLAETELSGLSLHRDTSMLIFEKYEKIIFERANISKDSYKESLSYYYNHPDKLDKIYEVVLDSLTLRESKIKAKAEAQKQKRDSLRSIKD